MTVRYNFLAHNISPSTRDLWHTIANTSYRSYAVQHCYKTCHIILITLQVRKSVLHILMAMYSKLGESLLILLPETIPFLAELLEGIT